MFKKKKLNQEEIKQIEILERKRKTLEDNKICIEKTLRPVLLKLDEIRIEIDNILYD